MEEIQTLFISHASADKQDYILPLATALTSRKVTFWLDNNDLGWGDSVALKINIGLRDSRYILLCLSNNFLARPWPESEMNAALSMQNEKGAKRVLPLILNSKEAVLKSYPILSGLVYREFNRGINSIADELAILAGKPQPNEGKIQIIIESVHTGQLSYLSVSPRVSIKWLTETARIGLGLQDYADIGSFIKFGIRWILVDAKAEELWKTFSRAKIRGVDAIIKTDTGVNISRNETDKLEDLGIYDGIIFHMCAVEVEHKTRELHMHSRAIKNA
jgi:hypothetical protein